MNGTFVVAVARLLLNSPAHTESSQTPHRDDGSLIASIAIFHTELIGTFSLPFGILSRGEATA